MELRIGGKERSVEEEEHGSGTMNNEKKNGGESVSKNGVDKYE